MHLLFTRGQGAAALLCRILVVGLFAGALCAQTPISVRELKRHFGSRYNKEQVTVQGWVRAEKRVSSRTFKAYYVKDRYGWSIVVRTVSPLPKINSEILVTGIALRDADSRRIYINETKREAIGPAREAAEEREAQEAAQEQEQARLVVIGLITVGLLLLVVLMLRRRKAAPAVPSPAPSPRPSPFPKYAPPVTPAPPLNPLPPLRPSSEKAPVASPTSVDDFKTVRVYKTTKILPGKLVILEDGQETDIIYLSDQSGRGEIEIGRDSQDITGGIRIKDKTNTLSRRQARLLYSASDKQFELVNLAAESSNATIINGRQMSVGEAVVLKDNDVLRMGNVELKFRKP